MPPTAAGIDAVPESAVTLLMEPDAEGQALTPQTGQRVVSGRARHVSIDMAALQGDPCPTLSKADYEARGAKAKQVFITNDIRYERRFGHADCNVVADGDGFAPVCQFSGPAMLVVTTPKGAFYFAPGTGRAATVVTRDGTPSCVLPKAS